MNALNKAGMTPMDDLESIFYLLCWIMACHTGTVLKPHALKHKSLPYDLQTMLSASTDKAMAQEKYSFIDRRAFRLTLQTPFESFLPLMQKYHCLLATHGEIYSSGQGVTVIAPPDIKEVVLAGFKQVLELLDEGISTARAVVDVISSKRQVEASNREHTAVTRQKKNQ
jgi:hypothetical protein